MLLEERLFNYNNGIDGSDSIKDLDLKDEFLHGWCEVLQYYLKKHLPEAEEYVIFDRIYNTKGEFYDDHQVLKYKGYYIDVRGIFTEEELLEQHKNEYVKCVLQGDPKILAWTMKDHNVTLEDMLKIESYLGKVESPGICDDENSLCMQCVEYIIHNILNHNFIKELMER